jgi:segregation and condensation protein A
MYNVKLQEFEGPLDLLLFFIKRDELDIYDIPIAGIAREFLDYVHFLKELDLEIAGEFVVMAAELMQIKVKMLLPPEQGPDEEADPRANLVKRLIEYKRFKESSDELRKQEEAAFQFHYRGYYETDARTIEVETGEDLVRDVSFFDLIASFKFVMDRIPKKFVHEIVRLNVTIDEMITYISGFFEKRSEATFSELVVEFHEKIRVVVTFLALLEVVRSRKVIVRQLEPFGELSIVRNVR